MEAALVALIAVAGTLLGSVVAHLLQRRQMNWRDAVEATGRLRDLHLNTYSSLAEAATAFRGAQIQRWLAGERHGKDSDQYASAKAEAFRVRVAARGAMFKVRMVALDEEVARLAAELVDHASFIHDADSREDLQLRADRSRQVHDDFISAAARQIAAFSQAGSEGGSTARW
ncbi:hypothetical protein [Catellatospora sichuanensis]|uniref:hypothetical protein n=1 Tax=Catellatospora sichuanensis TaxID=1969805 RepID=UPI001182862D|nr:hypothetical protein [Catellatospora sichuanensis]